MTNEPNGANTPDINEFLGKSPTNIKYTVCIPINIKQ